MHGAFFFMALVFFFRAMVFTIKALPIYDKDFYGIIVVGEWASFLIILLLWFLAWEGVDRASRRRRRR